MLLFPALFCGENGLPRRFAPRNDMQKIVALLRVQEGAAGASPQPPTNSPYVLLISTHLCGDADCHVASLLAMTGKNLLRVRTAMTSLAGVRAPGGGCNVLRFCQGTRIATPLKCTGSQ